jgi:hypothetical protein
LYKMKNKLLKIYITGLVLLVTGLADAATVVDPPLLTYSVISGAAVNIAAQPRLTENHNVGGHIAAQAAVTIGANTTGNDIYAGAAVTTGAGSQVKQIHAAAAAGVGTNAFAQDVKAGAAVTIGANGAVGDIKAGAAITLGVGATYSSIESSTITHGAGSRPNTTNGNYIDDGYINSPQDMTETLDYIDLKLKDPIYQYNPMIAKLDTDLSGIGIGYYGKETTVHYSAINLQANTRLHIEGKLTVIISEAMTMGAGATIKLGDNATVTWIIGGALNLGADSDFNGVAYVHGAVNGATSDVGAGVDSCANIYALGAVSIRSIGQQCDNAYEEDFGCPNGQDIPTGNNNADGSAQELDLCDPTGTSQEDVETPIDLLIIGSDFGCPNGQDIPTGNNNADGPAQELDLCNPTETSQENVETPIGLLIIGL